MRKCSSGGLGLAYIDMEDDYHIRQRNTIAGENDELRHSLPYIWRPNALRITKGVQLLEPYMILKKVKDYNDSPEDNDPYGHHNFGWFMHKGKKIFWTIDESPLKTPSSHLPTFYFKIDQMASF